MRHQIVLQRIRKYGFWGAEAVWSGWERRVLYLCNCNGIRERAARAAIAAGAGSPAELFRHCQSTPRCAKCVADMRRMIRESREALRHAAE